MKKYILIGTTLGILLQGANSLNAEKAPIYCPQVYSAKNKTTTSGIEFDFTTASFEGGKGSIIKTFRGAKIDTGERELICKYAGGIKVTGTLSADSFVSCHFSNTDTSCSGSIEECAVYCDSVP